MRICVIHSGLESVKGIDDFQSSDNTLFFVSADSRNWLNEVYKNPADMFVLSMNGQQQSENDIEEKVRDLFPSKRMLIIS